MKPSKGDELWNLFRCDDLWSQVHFRYWLSKPLFEEANITFVRSQHPISEVIIDAIQTMPRHTI